MDKTRLKATKHRSSSYFRFWLNILACPFPNHSICTLTSATCSVCPVADYLEHIRDKYQTPGNTSFFGWNSLKVLNCFHLGDPLLPEIKKLVNLWQPLLKLWLVCCSVQGVCDWHIHVYFFALAHCLWKQAQFNIGPWRRAFRIQKKFGQRDGMAKFQENQDAFGICQMECSRGWRRLDTMPHAHKHSCFNRIPLGFKKVTWFEGLQKF